jgi:tetraacyldisaccharide 4'-kinase
LTQKIGSETIILIPSGPLREPLTSIKEANFIIIKGEKNQIIENEIKKLSPNIEIIYAENRIENNETLKNKNFIAFTGIGNPYSFFNTLLNNNIKNYKTNYLSRSFSIY